jgi:hypothetical protein
MYHSMTEAVSSFTLLPANQTTSGRNMNIHLQEYLKSQQIGQTLRSEILLKCNNLYICQQFCNFWEKPAPSACTLSTFFRLRQQNFQCVNI